jgi:Putative phage serine protease XkdF
MAKDNLPVYKITIDPEYAENGEDLGIEQIAFTSTPAIKVLGLAFNSQVKPMIFTDDLKYRIVAPALIPMEIYRKDDEDGKEYYVSFSVEEIERIHSKFMKDMSNKDLFNLEHDTDKTVPAYVLEAWIVDTPKEDKAYSSFGIEVPEGTLMVTAQVTDKEYYNQLVADGQVGFSIEGYLGMKLKEEKQLKLNNMNKLPDGEHLIDGKIYVVVDGEITEIREEEVVEAELADTVVEEEEVVEEETMAVDPTMDAEAIIEIVRPFITEQVDALVAMIADLKNQLEESLVTETEEETMEEAVALSVQQRLSIFNKFNNNK